MTKELKAKTGTTSEKPEKEETPKKKGPSLRQRAQNLLVKLRAGPTLDPKVLKAETEKRLELVVARLESVDRGVANYPADMVKWWRTVELPALLQGTWSPSLRNMRDKKTNEMFGLLSRAGLPQTVTSEQDARLDDMLSGTPDPI
jgi:hypothetical protein